MGEFQIKKGRDIRIKGAALKELAELSLPDYVAIQPQDFRGIKPRLAVKEGDIVKAGSTLLTDKNNPDIRIVAPVSGTVTTVKRGDKRVLLQIVIKTDGRNDAVALPPVSSAEIQKLSREKAIARLLEGGLWPVIRQRPFSKIANPSDKPKAIFVQAMNTEPLAPDVDFILKEKQAEFQAGLDVLRHLTQGQVHLCYHKDAESKTFINAHNVQKHRFSGPHPAGNVSTHIHRIDPINKGDIVWYLEAQDVIRIARIFLNGSFSAERIVAVTGEGVEKRRYVRTVMGAPVKDLAGRAQEGMRYISGSILKGADVGHGGFLGFYDAQLTVIPEGGKRKLLGWIAPGVNAYSFSKTFVSSFLPEKESSLDTDKYGSDRAIVFNHVYDELVPLDIMTFFLLRAVISGDIEEAEKLGILECDEEDFALCSFACPSKTDVGGIIRSGLDIIEKEG